MSEKKDIWTKIVEQWWACILVGIVLIGITYLQYQDLAALESGEKEYLLVSRSTKLFYDMGGKITCAIIGGIMSAGMIIYGIWLKVSASKA